MRTTLTLDPDVATEIERRRRRDGRTLRQEVNDLLRIGLRHADAPPEPAERYEIRPLDAGDPLFPVDDVVAALDHAEGPGVK
jgi:hypothetical protein